MSKFKPGDRVRRTSDHLDTATILAIHDGYYWCDGEDCPCPYTADVTAFDRIYELTPESFLPNGDDGYCNYYVNGVVGAVFSSLDEADKAHKASPLCLGIIRIDGQTGELSWAKGGPNGVAS